MREITAYQCSDGSIHADEDKAKSHEEDLLGAELDGLLKLFNLDITRTQEYRALIGVMKKRKELHDSITAILTILDHGDDS